MYFYFGIDGLGSLDLENEEDEDVRIISSIHELPINPLYSLSEGIIRDREIHRVDPRPRGIFYSCRRWFVYLNEGSNMSVLNRYLGENPQYITEGQHADTYAGKLGKTSYAGLQMSPGKIRTARGKHIVFFWNI